MVQVVVKSSKLSFQSKLLVTMETMHLWTEKWKNWDFGLHRPVESCKRLVIPPVLHLNAFAWESEMFCR